MISKLINSLILELRFAVSFLTLLPVSPKEKVPEKDISNSIAFFSFTGLIFLFATLVIIVLNEAFQNQFVMAFFIILVHTLLSGGLHLDAVMDSHDGLACSDRPREEILRVMKDSRAGAFAVIALVLVVIAQLIFISQSKYELANYHYLLAYVPVFSRFFMVLELIFFVDSKELEAKSSLLVFSQAHKYRALAINLFVVLTLFFFYPMEKLYLFAFVLIALVFSVLIYRFLNHKLKGQNGDSIGCGLVLNETFMYLLLFWFSAQA
jgi:adenosylcobinamide-GDP ribazoletransferase